MQIIQQFRTELSRGINEPMTSYHYHKIAAAVNKRQVNLPLQNPEKAVKLRA